MAKIISSLPGSTGVLSKTSQLINDGETGISTYVELNDLSTVATTGDYNNLINIPIDFTPKVHTHNISDISGTKSEFNTSLTDGDFLFVGDVSNTPDATTTSKGVIKLAGDLAGTADAPTVPGLANKVDKVAGKSLIDNTEITRLATVVNQDISGKVDKVANQGLISDAEKLRLSTITNFDNSGNISSLSGKVDKVTGKSLIADAEIARLATLYNYTHPANHPPSIITQDASNRFVTDVEKTAWNAKQGALGFTPENIANKSDSYTASSSITYASTKALVEGLGTKQNTLTNPVTGTFVAGRVPYSSSNSTLTDSSKLLWNNTDSYFEVNGNAPRFTLKNNLNNYSTYFTNNANGTLYLKNHQDKTLAAFKNPMWSTAQPQMAIGNVSSIPVESQLYVYGGMNGANIDARGSIDRDEANIDLEGNDWETSPNSLGFSYFGSNSTAFGTMLGYAKNKLGVIRFQDTNYAIINSEKVAGVSPIRFGINDIEIGNVNDKGFSYQSDFSSENISNPRWLTDKAFVDTKVPLSEKGAINGVATLGSDGKVPNSQIPALTTANITDSAEKRYQTDNQKLFNDATSSIQTQLNGKQNNLVSGTNIKTIEGQSLLGLGNIDLVKADVGLSNVDNTSDLNKPISTATQTALNGKENSFTKNTAFNKNFGTTAGTVAEGNYPPAKDGTGATGTWGINISGNAASATSWGSREADLNDINNSVSFVTVLNPDGIIRVADPSGIKSFLGLGSNAYTSTAYLPLSGGTLSGIVTAPTAAPGTTGNQIATLDYVLANAPVRPYKVYTALLSQTGTSAPTATVLENTLGGTVVWTRFGTGIYKATLSNAFTSNKTFLLTGLRASAGATYSTILTLLPNTASEVQLMTTLSDAARSLNDGLLTSDSVEIRVYN